MEPRQKGRTRKPTWSSFSGNPYGDRVSWVRFLGKAIAWWGKKGSKGSVRPFQAAGLTVAPSLWLNDSGVRPALELGEQAEPGPLELIFLNTRDTQASAQAARWSCSKG